MIGGNVDLDLLSLFPQEGARIIGGIERKQSSRGSTMEERELAKDKKTVGEEDPSYRPPPNPTVTCLSPHRAVLPLHRAVLPLGR